MGLRRHREITTSALNPEGARLFVQDPRAGALVVFTGTARNHTVVQQRHRSDVDHLRYEAYEGVAHNVIDKIIDDAGRRWPGLYAVHISHRVGRVEITEPAVVVAVSSAHRDVAFDAARFLIDTLKAEVPLWKTEHFIGDED